MLKSFMPSSAWTGSPPTVENGFAFMNGEFFAESSGRNRHRRATKDEIKKHFRSGTDKDYPAHWFEAQLIHYGLQPSKTKSTARMRLLDALNGGKLIVPKDIAQLEEKLKKESARNDRAVKKALRASETATPSTRIATKVATGTKRQLEVNVTVSVKDGKEVIVKAVKKPRTEKATTTTSLDAAAKAEATTSAQRGIGRARRGMTSRGSCRSVATNEASPSQQRRPRTIQTARSQRGTHTSGPSRRTETAAAVVPETQSSPPRTKQTARRGKPFVPAGRIPAPQIEQIYEELDEVDDAPPPYSGYDCGYENDDGEQYSSHMFDWDRTELAPLGLLNGSYDIKAPYVEEQWDYNADEFEITFTLSGNSLWGRFDLGVLQGIILFDERPWQSSFERLPFRWRGREDNGPIWDSDTNKGWITFYGDGRIEGQFCFQSIKFIGRRGAGQGTRSTVSVSGMRDEWAEYSSDRYEDERENRWY